MSRGTFKTRNAEIRIMTISEWSQTIERNTDEVVWVHCYKILPMRPVKVGGNISPPFRRNSDDVSNCDCDLLKWNDAVWLRRVWTLSACPVSPPIYELVAWHRSNACMNIRLTPSLFRNSIYFLLMHSGLCILAIVDNNQHYAKCHELLKRDSCTNKQKLSHLKTIGWSSNL